MDRCRKYNACVIYLVHGEEDNEVDAEEILTVEAGMTRRSGLSVGTALVTMDQLYEVTMPRNTIATVTISDKGKITPAVGHQLLPASDNLDCLFFRPWAERSVPRHVQL